MTGRDPLGRVQESEPAGRTPAWKNGPQIGMAPIGKPDEARSWDGWRRESGRSSEIWSCDSCDAQLDVQPDGRRKIVTPHKDLLFDSLYPEEWARVAAGLEPGAGNASCNGCDADYFVDDVSLTLLDARDDPFGFSERYLGRRIGFEDARWLAVGKESPNPGLHCPKCDSEFDQDGEYLRLVRSHSTALSKYAGEPFTLEDWHRIAQKLPTVGDQQAFVQGIEKAIEMAYVEGRLWFDAKQTMIWNGSATELSEGREANLTVTEKEISFGGALRRSRIPLDALVSATAHDNTLALAYRGASQPVEYDVEPMELSVALKSGARSATLTAAHLARRLTSQ